jgi:phytanoyl-CoA dioxygenase PhyH
MLSIDFQMNRTYARDVTQDGYAVLSQLLDPETVSHVLQAFANTKIDIGGSQRAGKAFGIRNLLNVVPLTRELANSAACRSVIDPVLGSGARVVRGIYFDKHKDANWKVAWHQDTTIAVRERFEVDGYGPWSIKAGFHHVQPPASVLENMLTLRIHLDHTDESNGALRVLPGTHQYGRLDASQIEHWKRERKPVTCVVERGGAVLMRPLLLHSSFAAVNPGHRRVLHFEYSSIDLAGGLRWFERAG